MICNKAGKEFESADFVDNISGFGPHLKVCDIDHDGREDVVVSAKGEIIVLGVGEDGSLERKFTAGNGSHDTARSNGAQSGFAWPPTSRPQLGRFRHMKFFDTDGDGKGELVTPENTGGDQWRLVVWKYENGDSPGLRRAWTSAEPIYGFPWIVEGRLSKKIQDRLENMK
jgi:hypothetical protein